MCCRRLNFPGMRWFVVILLALLAAVGGAGWHFRAPLAVWWAQRTGPIASERKPIPKPDAESYTNLAADLEKWRDDLARQHGSARTADEKAAVENDARLILETVLPAMMRCWLGTPWDFHGTASLPGEGRIACGYFVSTVLKDAGFRVDRYRLAQQPSENILRTFLPRESCKLTIGRAYHAFAADLLTSEPGIYIIGLDTHVAFLVVDAEGFRFIHSSGSRPWCVVDESREEAEVLKHSNWRMIGNLTADPNVVRRWLEGAAIPVKGA